jgi:hypothetical protein
MESAAKGLGARALATHQSISAEKIIGSTSPLFALILGGSYDLPAARESFYIVAGKH